MVARWKSDAFATASSRTHTLGIVGVTICSATPRCLAMVRVEERGSIHGTYDFQSSQSPKLDSPMEPPKDDRGWIVDHVHRIASPQTPQFDCLHEEEHKYSLSPETSRSIDHI